jgi:Tol biopolymer transport system component/imidazolonepropionase-like amidohydrolase
MTSHLPAAPRSSLPLALVWLTIWLAVPAVLAQPSGAQQAEEPGWDVNDPPFPTYEVQIDVTEGTWMSLDVSPDGREIVFDLLGDLYLMPIEGGEARALTHEIAWNMQPRFSPDGRWIAFTSDRGGGDNIWVMERDGSNPQQVTDESFRLLNGPAWTPDSEYIVARKHFTGTRSLGSGEMWMYHRSGGSGVQLTERPNDQKDVNEPALSPDGRWLYFSQDVTPGDLFEYNKDPNAGIYAIRRLDRETGELTTLTGGPGGAVRPTPSPDGRTLAFVKRIRGDTHLFLRDLESGREWSVFDGLERDMQEIWAIHGVYPAMAWTPDGGSIVFWAAGGIHRIDAASGEVTQVPFRVRTSRRLAEAVRFPVEVHPDSFDVRMLRWTQVSPDGNRVLFSAMGHLYVQDLPDGTPGRLTTQDEHYEYFPSWSRDGRRIVYVSWHDEELGAVRVIDAGGGVEGTVITSEPGHYAEPAFSPDGATVVYRKGTGGGIVSPLWSERPGIYQVPAEGGEPVFLTSSGRAPHFGAAPDRVYLIDTDEGQQALKSVGLGEGPAGAAERVHLRSEWATDFRVAPDGRHVVFVERFHAYLRPFTPTGGPVDVGPESRDLPQQRLTRDAGDYLHWSGDGERLHWSLGPELFTLPVSRAFGFLAEEVGEAAADLPLAEGVDLSFRVASDAPVGTVAFTGARIITMVDDEVIEDGTLVVEGNRITAVGPRGEVAVPADAHVIDASGHTVMPGMVDVHWHGSQGSGGIQPQRNVQNHASLAFGVTTIHDPSNSSHEIFTSAEMARAGLQVAPRIFSTGQILYGATTGFTAQIDSLEDARTHVRRLAALGAISVKSYNQPRRDQRQQVLTAAREEGIMVVPEGGALFQHNLTMVVDGHTGIEHSLSVENLYDDAIRMWSESDVGITPTLVVAYGGLWGEEYWYSHTEVWENERLATFTPPLQLEARSRRRMMVPDEEWNHVRAAAHINDLYQAGVGVQLGAHGQRSGLDAHWELWNFVLGGMPEHDALKVATIEGARYLGMDADIGSLEEGKLADLLVLEADPLDDIRNSERIRWTMVNGRLFDARTLDEAGNHPRERGPFYWEEWGWR